MKTNRFWNDSKKPLKSVEIANPVLAKYMDMERKGYKERPRTITTRLTDINQLPAFNQDSSGRLLGNLAVNVLSRRQLADTLPLIEQAARDNRRLLREFRP